MSMALRASANSRARVASPTATIAAGLAQRGVDRRALDVGHRHAGFVDDGTVRSRSRIERIDRCGLQPSAPCSLLPAPSYLDHLHALRRALLDAMPQLLELHLHLDERPENELELLTRDLARRSDRVRDAHRHRARALADVARDVARADLAFGR